MTIKPAYRRPGVPPNQFSWYAYCDCRPCQDREARRGHMNYFGRPTKAEFAKELIHDGWTYRGANRWWCAKCSAVASGKQIIKHLHWGLFRAVPVKPGWKFRW